MITSGNNGAGRAFGLLSQIERQDTTAFKPAQGELVPVVGPQAHFGRGVGQGPIPRKWNPCERKQQ